MMLPLVFAACVMSCMTNTMQAYHHDNINNSVNVNDPDYKYGLNFTTLFLKPTTQLSGATQTINTTSGLPSWQNISLSPNYHFAFDLGAKLAVRSKETILKGNWEHFLASENGSEKNTAPAIFNVVASPNTVNSSSSDMFNVNSVAYKNVSGSIFYQRDKMNLVYGQLVNFGENLTMGLYGGVSFTRLHVNTYERYATNNVAGSFVNYSERNTASSFSGVGPEFCLDMSYHLHKGLSFVLNETVDFLTGTENTHTTFITSHSGLPVKPVAQTITGKGRLEIVPVFSQKIGMQYEIPFRGHCECQMEIGYQSQIYIDAVFINEYSADDNSTYGTIDYITMHNRMSNFGLSGPYFKIDMAF